MGRSIFQCRRGHTMAEATIAVLILGICMAIAAPRMNRSIQNTRIDTTVKRIQADLQYARQLARQSSAPQTVEFSVDDNSYLITGAEGLGQKNTDYKMELGDPTCGATIIGVDFDGKSDLVFEPSGRLKNPGILSLRFGNTPPLDLAIDVLGRVTLLEAGN